MYSRNKPPMNWGSRWPRTLSYPNLKRKLSMRSYYFFGVGVEEQTVLIKSEVQVVHVAFFLFWGGGVKPSRTESVMKYLNQSISDPVQFHKIGEVIIKCKFISRCADDKLDFVKTSKYQSTGLTASSLWFIYKRWVKASSSHQLVFISLASLMIINEGINQQCCNVKQLYLTLAQNNTGLKIYA